MRARRPRLRIAVVLALALACAYTETGERQEVRDYTVERTDARTSAESWQVVLRDESCPGRTLVLGPIAGERRDERREDAARACLASLAVGSRVTYSKRRVKQGCMPGKVYWTFLDECPAKYLEQRFEGEPCPAQPR